MGSGRRIAAGIVDQVLSSAGNALILVSIARVTTVTSFGSVALLFVFIAAALAITRGFLGTPIAARAGNRGELEREAGHALYVVLAIAVPTGLIAAAILLAQPNGSEYALLGVSLVAVLPQDVLRYVVIAKGRVSTALAADGLWFVGSVAALAATVAADVSLSTILVAWTASAYAALALIWIGSGVRPRGAGLGSWLRERLAERVAFGTEGSVSAINSAANSSIVAAALGIGATAAFRGAATIVGPLSLLMSALPLVIAPELARKYPGRPGRDLWPALLRVGLTLSPLAILVGSAGFWLPDSIGAEILGESWHGARTILPLAGLEYASLVWMHAAGAGFRVLGAGKRLLSVRLSFAFASILTTSVLATSATLVHVAGGLAAVAAMFAAVSVICLLRTGPPSLEHGSR